MKIGIVCYPTYGGSGVLATELGVGLAKRGHEVHFIAYRMPARLPAFQKNIFFHEVRIYDYPLFEYTPYESALASKLVHVITTEGLDLLHVHYAIPHASVAFLTQQILLRQGYNIPFVTTLHGTDITLVGSDPSFAPVACFSISASTAVTAVSNYLKEITEATFKIDRPIEVIYNFVDLERFKLDDKHHFKKAIASQGERIVIHVSNFRKVKRVDDVVRAFHLIQQEISAKLLLVGDGPERMVVEALVQQLELQDSVLFLGKQDAVEELLSISDIFLLPSEKESFGLSALEAMACGVPVISSDAGGLPEVNLHGETGYIAPVGDVQGMARYAIEMLSDDTVYKRMSTAAYERAKAFDVHIMVDAYLDLYHRVMSQQVNVNLHPETMTNFRAC